MLVMAYLKTMELVNQISGNIDEIANFIILIAVFAIAFKYVFRSIGIVVPKYRLGTVFKMFRKIFAKLWKVAKCLFKTIIKIVKGAHSKAKAFALRKGATPNTANLIATLVVAILVIIII